MLSERVCKPGNMVIEGLEQLRSAENDLELDEMILITTNLKRIAVGDLTLYL